MPLPNPDYLTLEYYNWSEFQTPAVLLTQLKDITITGSNRSIRWDACDAYDRPMVHDLIMGYASRKGVIEANAVTGFPSSDAYQIINYSGTLVAGNLVAGLTNGQTYTATAVINAVENLISIVAANTDTYTDLLVKINADLTDATMIINTAGDFEISSNALGAPEIVEIFDIDLFTSIDNFKELEEIRVGVTTIGEVLDLNFRNKHQSYASLLIGADRNVLNKAPRSAKNVNDIYFNHGTATWLKVSTDLA